MPEQSYKKEVQSFIGMLNYLSKFSARLSELSETYLKKEFHLTGDQNTESFQCDKERNSGSTNPTILWPQQGNGFTDTSIKGLGACLMQQGKPVYFTSIALTETQKGYVAIELESLAVAWAMEKFHHFLYGTHFILETDQNPLEAILSKSLNQATPWLQRILIQTFPYYFAVHHIPGPMNQLANCLSRLGSQNDNIKLPKLHIYQITIQLKTRSDTLNQLHIATQEDDKLILLKHMITNGWPNSIKEVPPEIQTYWTFHEELTIWKSVD